FYRTDYNLRGRLPYLTRAGEYLIFATYFPEDSVSVNSDTSKFYLQPLPENELKAKEDFYDFLGVVSPRGIIIRGKEFLTNHPNSIFKHHVLRITSTAMNDNKQFDDSIKLLKDELNVPDISPDIRGLLYYSLAWSYYRKGEISIGIECLKHEEVNGGAKHDLIRLWGFELKKQQSPTKE
ncbi:MAG: hypothetical protein IT258_10565, partial [Saprospiraceae bacterium]|nr:hypothetical protein [Saprospiraceae bacterium]